MQNMNFAELLGEMKADLSAESSAKMGVILTLLVKAGITDAEMIAETVRQQIDAMPNEWARARLGDLLKTFENGGRFPLEVIEGGRQD